MKKQLLFITVLLGMFSLSFSQTPPDTLWTKTFSLKGTPSWLGSRQGFAAATVQNRIVDDKRVTAILVSEEIAQKYLTEHDGQIDFGMVYPQGKNTYDMPIMVLYANPESPLNISTVGLKEFMGAGLVRFLERVGKLQNNGLRENVLFYPAQVQKKGNEFEVTAWIPAGLASELSGQDRIPSTTTIYTKEHPSHAEGHYYRGIEFAQGGNIDKAISEFDEAIRINPHYTSAFYDRGVAWDIKGDVDRAIADWTEAIQLNPNYWDAYYNRGSALSEQKQQYDSAISDFTRALEIKPTDSHCYTNRAACWYFMKDYEKAWADVKRCREAGGTPNPKLIELLRGATVRTEKVVYATSKLANVRSGPGKLHEVVFKVTRGDKLLVLESGDSWSRILVESTKKEGWIYTALTASKLSHTESFDPADQILALLNDPKAGGKAIGKLRLPDFVVLGTFGSQECRLDIFEGSEKRYYILSVRVQDGIDFRPPPDEPTPVKWGSLERIGNGSSVLDGKGNLYTYLNGNWQRVSRDTLADKVIPLFAAETFRNECNQLLTFSSEIRGMQWTWSFPPRMKYTTGAERPEWGERTDEIRNFRVSQEDRVQVVPGGTVEFSTVDRFIVVQMKSFEK